MEKSGWQRKKMRKRLWVKRKTKAIKMKTATEQQCGARVLWPFSFQRSVVTLRLKLGFVEKTSGTKASPKSSRAKEKTGDEKKIE